MLGAAALLGITGAAAAQHSHFSAARFHAVVVGSSRTPFAGVPWRYTVRAVDSSGHAVRGTTVVSVLVGGQPVDRVGQFGLGPRGRLRGRYSWSTILRGSRAVLQAKVTGPGGTRTATYLVRVRSYSGNPRFAARVTGRTHVPRAGAAWPFTVRALDSSGHPVSGTAIVRVIVRGRVVDTVGWFGFKGTLTKTYRWSRTLRGSLALLQANVVGPGGTRTVGYAVRVR